MIIMPSNEIRKYICLDENGQWIHDPNMPKELQPVFEEFLKQWEEAQKYKKSFY